MSIVISAGLSPSNAGVEGYGQVGGCFPNYAGRDDVDDLLRKELEDAGIPAKSFELFRRDGEVRTAIYGEIEAWGFRRAWYYWVADGPGIPPQYADELHRTHGTQVRVDGHCACPSPLEWHKGFAVGTYHVDTPAGLRALADTIKLVVSDAQKRKAAQ